MRILCIASVNGAIYGVGAWIARSRDFVPLCLSGEYAELLAVARYLDEQDVAEGQLALDVQYDDPLRTGKKNTWAHRMLYLLRNEEILPVPNRLAGHEAGEEFLEWARRRGVRYLLGKPADAVRRVWHLRVESLWRGPFADPPDCTRRFYVLYRIDPDGLTEVHPPAERGKLPESVPFLSQEGA